MMKDKKGIALIMAIGILALLVVIATSFALNMRLEYRAASNYYNTVKAYYRAEAAIERAIFELKTHVQASAFDDLNEQWAASWAYADNIDEPNDAVSNILDEQRKVNVNTGNQTLLENLFLELNMSALEATAVWNKINANRPYINIQELILKDAAPGALTETEYNIIEDDVTVTSYVDPSTTRSPVNVNTCDGEVLRAILRGIIGSIASISVAEATAVADDIINGSTTSGNTDGRPFSSWADFEACLAGSLADGDGITTTEEFDLIMDNCNPNRAMPMISNTTKFCFNSGGYYEITGTGTVGPAGQEVATKEVKTIAKIYDIYNETTRAQFEQGAPVRVTWFDDCPIDDDDWYGSPILPAPDSYERVLDSLKIGFFDNFDEDPAFSNSEWTGNAHVLGNADTSDSDNEMYSAVHQWPVFRLSDTTKWTWTYSTIRVNGRELITKWEYRDVLQVQCNAATLAHGRPNAPLSWQAGWYYRDIAGACTYSNEVAYAQWIFPSRFVRFHITQFTVFGDGTMSPAVDHPYSAQKTFNIRHHPGGFDATMWAGGLNSTIPYPTGGPTTFNFYSHASRAAWDDIRIVPADGNYTSITYTPIASGSDVAWGTMAFTGTEQTNTTISTDASLEGGAFTPVNLAGTAVNGGGGSIGATLADSIRYKVNFTSDSNMLNTPILEDVTITYLPSTEIWSWSK